MKWEHLAESDKEQNVSVATTNQSNIDSRANHREKNSTGLKFSSSTGWAEKTISINIESVDSWGKTHFVQVLKGKKFLKSLHEKINAFPTVKEQLFAPFQSKFYIENSGSILSGLFSVSIDKENDNQINITGKGHSIKAADLITAAVKQNLNEQFLEESKNEPLHPMFVEMQNNLSTLKNRIRRTKVELQDTLDSKDTNIESIAINSEILQLNEENISIRNDLKSVGDVFKEGHDVYEYTHISSIYAFGRIPDILSSIKNLELMLNKNNLDNAIKNEVDKNIKSNHKLLETEVAKAIEFLKTTSINNLQRVSILKSRIVDLNEEKLSKVKGNAKYKLLKTLEAEFEATQLNYDQLFNRWSRVKSSYSKSNP
ncbi:MAG: hypothetical protein VX130_08040 [Verrucomicrobiota bacterium]|nr:hypothetical protein [Verrucomicrobiota bacterium]